MATIWVAFDSKKRKNIDWFWVLVVLLLGPLLLPVYMSVRPLLSGEKRSGGLCWNVLVNFEKFFVWIAGLAATVVFVENISTPHDKDLAEVKRAEIKAGTILGAILVIVLIGFEKVLFGWFRKRIEN
jgi:hypothetical protein